MLGTMSNSSLFTRIILISLLVLLLACGSYIVHADSVGPSVTELSPQPNSTIGPSAPLFSLRFSDPDALDTSVLLQLDGQNVTPVITWDGFYTTYTDSCSGDTYSVRTGDDYTKGKISCQFPQTVQGQHTIHYQLKDRAGNITESTYTFTISDTEGPKVVEFTPANGSTISGGNPTVMAKLSDANSIVAGSVYLTLKGNTVSFPYDPVTRTATYKLPEPLKNGTYQAIITAKDEFNNSSQINWSFTVLDNSPPAITNLFPADRSFVYSTTPAIGASISDPSGIVNPVSLKIDDQTYDVEFNPQTGKVSYTPGELSMESHTVSLAVYDFQGNAASVSWQFNIDQSPPVITDLSPGPYGQVEALRPKFTMKFNDQAQLDPNVILEVDGQRLTTSIAWDGIYATYEDSCSGGYYTVRVGNDYTKGGITAQGPKLAAGEHTFHYILKDKLGNTAEDSYTFTVSDTTGPQAEYCSPAQGATVSTGYPAITVKLIDANFIVADSVYLSLDGTLVNSSYDAANRTITYNVPDLLMNGSHTVGLLARDELGNLTDTSWTFTVADVAPPLISNFVPADNSITYSITPLIEANITDPSGIESPIYLQLDSDNYEIPYNPVIQKVSYIPTSPLGTGQHTVTMVAYDLQGQRASETWSFTVDRSAPEMTVLSPKTGETITTVSPLISLQLYDPSGIDAARLQVKLDTSPITPAFEYDGIYQTYYDSCSGEYTVRVGDDVTKGTISYQANNLENLKEHTVDLYVYDRLGNTNHYSWSFTVHDNLPPEISSLVPLPLSVTGNSLPTISAKITDNNKVDPVLTYMTLNDQRVGSYNETTKVISHSPTAPLPDGPYTVAVYAYDPYGNQRTEIWGFEVTHTGAPSVTVMKPYPNTGTRSLKPTISAHVSDDRGLDLTRINLTVDGAPVTATFKPDTAGSVIAGTISGVPAANLSNAMHTVVLTAFDLSGNIKQAAWKFGVNQFGDMGVGGRCIDCHNEGIAAIERRHVAGAGNCGLCHTLTVVGSEPDCCYCHDGAHTDSWPPPIGNYACEECHNASLAYAIPTHGSPQEIDVHNYAALGNDCKGCHSTYLTREHNIYVEGTGTAYNCNTCHKSTKTEVQQAISGHNRACTACHGPAGQGHEQFHVSAIDGKCAGCHQATLTTDHSARGLMCATCHSSDKSKVNNAVAANNKQCAACHSSWHNMKLTSTIPADIPLYSGYKWSAALDAALWSSEPWMDADLVISGNVLLSDRQQGVTLDPVKQFYTAQMTANGWTPIEQAMVFTDYLKLVYTKDNRTAYVFWFTGQAPNTLSDTEGGSRIVILYN